MLTQKQIKDIISYYTGETRYPRNYTREYIIPGVFDEFYRASDVAKVLNEGDTVRVVVRDRDGWSVENICFTISYTKYVQDWVNSKENYQYKRRRDYQRQRVYDFESYLIAHTQHNYKLHTEESIVRLYQYIYALLGISEKTIPAVEITKQNKSTSSHRSWVIRLAHGWGQYLKVVLHELAHDIVDTMEDKEEFIAHGKTFVSVILALYEYFIPDWPKELAFQELSKRKIKWSKQDYNQVIDALSGKSQLIVSPKLTVDRCVALKKFMT